MYQDTLCKLQAHRGVCTEAPENTMAAFRLAVEQGYDIIEFDPKFTADNVCVVLHDRTLNRTGRIAGQSLGDMPVEIKKTAFACLSDIDVGLWFDPSFCGEHIPTFSQALDYIKSAGVQGKIDNVVQSFTAEQQEILFTLLEKHGCNKIGLTCSDLNLLKIFAARFPEHPLHYDGPVSKEALDNLARFAKGHPTTVWMRLDNKLTSWNSTPPADLNYAKMIKSYGFELGIWILSDDEEMKEALILGADVVETTGSIKP